MDSLVSPIFDPVRFPDLLADDNQSTCLTGSCQKFSEERPLSSRPKCLNFPLSSYAKRRDYRGICLLPWLDIKTVEKRTKCLKLFHQILENQFKVTSDPGKYRHCPFQGCNLGANSLLFQLSYLDTAHNVHHKMCVSTFSSFRVSRCQRENLPSAPCKIPQTKTLIP